MPKLKASAWGHGPEKNYADQVALSAPRPTLLLTLTRGAIPVLEFVARVEHPIRGLYSLAHADPLHLQQ